MFLSQLVTNAVDLLNAANKTSNLLSGDPCHNIFRNYANKDSIDLFSAFQCHVSTCISAFITMFSHCRPPPAAPLAGATACLESLRIHEDLLTRTI